MNVQEHANHLRFEIEVLKSRIQKYDTGHFHTAITVLENRVKEIEKESTTVLDSSYPDGDGYWQTNQ